MMNPILSVVAGVCVSTVVVCGSSDPLVAGAWGTCEETVHHINSLRSAEGLPSLELDEMLSDVIARKLSKHVDELPGETLSNDAWVQIATASVPDWETHCFTASGMSSSELPRRLEVQPGFMAALLMRDVTHLALGCCRTSEADERLVLCIIRRLVHLGPFEVEVQSNGPTYLSVRGVSLYRHVRARFYKSDEGPASYDGIDYSVDISVDENGRFCARLPISIFGDGEYLILLYVAEDANSAYEIAVRTRFRVGD